MHGTWNQGQALKAQDKFGVLFTCIGRRVSLLESFRSAAKKLGLGVVFIGADTTELSPAWQLCDEKKIVQRVTHKDYVSQLLAIVRTHRVRLLVPTVDLDLRLLARNKDKFTRLGCEILVSSPEIIDICQDKRKTCRFLSRRGFDTPVTISVATALKKPKMQWPCFVKPWDGYASRGNAVVRTRRELLFYSKRVPNPICQEFVEGTEYTCDAYVDFSLDVRTVVPRKRIEVRAGEVSKGKIVKDERIMSQAADVVRALGAGPGVITLQLFVTTEGSIKFIEINPRFGGGVPLSIKAGADFPMWILQELTGKTPNCRFDGFEDGLVMLRYDGEVWCRA